MNGASALHDLRTKINWGIIYRYTPYIQGMGKSFRLNCEYTEEHLDEDALAIQKYTQEKLAAGK